VYEKCIQEKHLFNHQMEEKRHRKVVEELSNLRPSPGMNEKSRKIIFEKMKEEKPIYLRYQEEIENKKNKLENLKQNLIHEKYDGCIKKSKSFSQASFNEWVKTSNTWFQKKEEKLEILKKIYSENEEESEQLIFKPAIDKTSELIVNYKNKLEPNDRPFYEKLYSKHEEKLRKLEIKRSILLPTFKPKINKNFQSSNNYTKFSTSKTFYYEEDDNKSYQSQNKIQTQKLTGEKNLNFKEIKINRSKSNSNLVPRSTQNSPVGKLSSSYRYFLNVSDSSFWRLAENNIILNTKPTRKSLY
jgi:hypothetical protein